MRLWPTTRTVIATCTSSQQHLGNVLRLCYPGSFDAPSLPGAFIFVWCANSKGNTRKPAPYLRQRASVPWLLELESSPCILSDQSDNEEQSYQPYSEEQSYHCLSARQLGAISPQVIKKWWKTSHLWPSTGAAPELWEKAEATVLCIFGEQVQVMNPDLTRNLVACLIGVPTWIHDGLPHLHALSKVNGSNASSARPRPEASAGTMLLPSGTGPSSRITSLWTRRDDRWLVASQTTENVFNSSWII